jgi:hypothetical protein
VNGRAATTTTTPTLGRAEVFGDLPDGLQEALVNAFNEIVRNYREGRWEPAELNGGKVSEVVYSVVRGLADGRLPASASKPRDMVAACKAMEQATSVPRSVRIQIPRMLVALYEIRNNRSVGHVGGDVDPNHMDAMCVLHMAKWLMAELVRVLHDVPVDEATAVVELLSDRTLPVIWEVGDRKRVLRTDLSMRDKSLLVLHATPGAVAEAELVRWVEHSNPSVYRRGILRKAHQDRLLEYDEAARTAEISPLGTAYVEENLPLHV